MQANAVKNISNNLQLQARSQDFCWGGCVCAPPARNVERRRRELGVFFPRKF